MSPEAAAVDRTIAALADPHRRRVVELLTERPRRAGELATAVGVTPSVMSKHLRMLRQSGLVSDTHAGFDARVRVYSLRSGPMADLRRWLDSTEQAWADQLSSFKEHVERSG